MTQEWMQKLGIQDEETAQKVEQLLEALEERSRLLTEKNAALEKEKTLAEEALQQAKKIGAVEKLILEAGGKNAKAILALIDLETVRKEAPYLFTEKEEKTKGTGFQAAYSRKKGKESEVAQTFRKALRR